MLCALCFVLCAELQKCSAFAEHFFPQSDKTRPLPGGDTAKRALSGPLSLARQKVNRAPNWNWRGVLIVFVI